MENTKPTPNLNAAVSDSEVLLKESFDNKKYVRSSSCIG